MKNKEISCRITHTLLSYVRERNNGTLGDFLADLPLDEEFLYDTNNWISHAFLQELYHRLVKLMNDENAVYYMAMASARYQSLGILERIVRLLGTPRMVYSQAPRYNQFLKLNGTVVIHEITKDTVLLEDCYHEGWRKTRYDCDYTRGILAGIPTLFSLPPAEVEELECEVEMPYLDGQPRKDPLACGCDRCLYRVTWQPESLPFFKRMFSGYFQQRKAIEDLAEANQLIQSKYDEVKFLLSRLEEKNRQLEASEGNHRLLAENMTDLVWILDLETLKVTYVSPSVFKIRGFTPEEVLAMKLEDSVCPESYANMFEILAEELEKDGDPDVDPNRTRKIELRDSVKGGGYLWAEANVKFLRDENGKPVRVIGVNRYIDDRKAAEEIIAKNERKYRNLFENGSDLLCIHDLYGVLLDTNLHYKDEYGWAGIDLTGKNLKEMIPEQYHDAFEEYLVRIKEKGHDEGFVSGQDLNGNYIILEYRNKLILDENYQPLHVQGAGRDVTEQFKARKALKESEDKYKSLVRYAPAGIFEFDLENFRFLSVNDTMCKYTGFSREELLKANPFDLMRTDGNEEILKKMIQEVREEKPEENAVELAIRTRTGQIRYIMINSRYYYEKGVLKRSMGAMHDMTAIRKAEKERRLLETKLQQAHKMEAIGTLAGGIAHDFNNILAGILGYCELLKNNISKPEKINLHVDRIQQGAKRAADLVKQILDFSRERDYEIRPVVLSSIVTEALKLLRATLPMTIEIKEDLANSKSILADPAKVHQVIMNLGTNAYHAMADQGGTLMVSIGEVSLAEREASDLSIKPGEYVTLNIADTGHGMPESMLKRIFDPYFTTKEIGKGSGMGLAIVYAIIQEHGGAVSVKSIPEKGSEFTVYFQVAPEQETVPESSGVISEPVTGTETIMVVDDETSILESTKGMLEDYGYHAVAFSDGKQALDAFLEDPHRFDLVITDMTMPEMTGIELTRRIFEVRNKMPVILCTGYNENISETQAIEMGIARFLEKPVVDQSLPKIIREVLDQG